MPASDLPVAAIAMLGIGATLLSDLWALFLKSAFHLTPSNMCLVGRWLLYMGDGIFRHASLASAPRKRGECPVGWLGHYVIGILFASIFIAMVGRAWLKDPTLLPALGFDLVSIAAPFLIMQPAFGLGVASWKSPDSVQARLRTLANHAAFGVGLYVSAFLVSTLT
jgi:hypothetical protein